MEFFSEKNIKKQSKTKKSSMLKNLSDSLKSLIHRLSFFELILALAILGSISYFANYYAKNNGNFYIEISKGTVFAKDSIASLDSIYQ